MTLLELDQSRLEETLWEALINSFDWNPEDQDVMTCVEVLVGHEVELADLVLLCGKELNETSNRAKERQPNGSTTHF